MAKAAGPEAFARWKHVNNYYDGRMKRVNDPLAMVVGERKNATPNQAFSAMQAMLRTGWTGNAAAFMRIMRSMPPGDARAIRAAIVSEARGGSRFDPDKLAKTWGQMFERGKSALLPQSGMRSPMDDAVEWAAIDLRNPLAGMRGEQVFAALQRMAGNKRDAARFRATFAQLSPDKAGAVRSTFIDQAGRAAADALNADGTAFSISRWLTRWNSMTPTAKTVLFGSGELRGHIDDLALLAEWVKATEKLAGHSSTGAVNSFDAKTGGLWSAVAALLTGHPVIAAGLAAPAAYQRISAEMLTSQRLLKWLTKAPKKPDTGAEWAHLDVLSKIAADEPVISNNVIQLQAYLRQAVEQSPGRAAAAQSPTRPF